MPCLRRLAAGPAWQNTRGAGGGCVNTGSRYGAAPWTLGDHRVWGHQQKGREGASGAEKRRRKKPTRAEEETDGDRQTGAGAAGLFERLPGQRPHTVDTRVPLPLRTKQRTAAGPHASPRPASWPSGSRGRNPPSPGQGGTPVRGTGGRRAPRLATRKSWAAEQPGQGVARRRWAARRPPQERMRGPRVAAMGPWLQPGHRARPGAHPQGKA